MQDNLKRNICSVNASKHRNIVFIVWFICGSICHSCLSLNSDHLKPYQFESKSLFFDNKNHEIIYLGNVRIVQGTSVLTGDKIRVLLSPTNKMTHIIAVGDPAHYSTLLDNKPVKLFAEAKSIIFDPIDKTVVLQGNARVKEENNIFKGPKIWYDIKHGIVHSAKSTKQNKTVIVIQPQK